MSVLEFPDAPLDLRVQLFLAGQWLDMGPVVYVHSDFYTDTYTDEYIGALGFDLRRLPYQTLSISCGRADGTATADPTSVSFVLWNDDGWLTPGDKRSPWWPTWDLGARCRILIGETVVFQGEVSQINPEWPFGDLSVRGGVLLDEDDEPLLDEDDEALLDEGLADPGYSQVTITASGLLRRLGQGARPLRSALHRAVVAPANLPSVSDYWPMEDGDRATEATSGLPETIAPMVVEGMKFAADPTHPGSEPLPYLEAGKGAYWSAPVTQTSSNWTYVWFVKMPEAPAAAGETVLFQVDGANGAIQVILLWEPDGTDAPVVDLWHLNRGGKLINHTAEINPPSMFWDGWTQFILRPDGDALLLTWIQMSEARDAWGIALFDYTGIGRPKRIWGQVRNAAPGGFGLGHHILHTRSQEESWLQPADIGHDGEFPLSRFARLCAEEGITANAVGGEPDATTMGPQKAAPLPDLLNECAEADYGVLTEFRAGLGLNLLGRMWRYNRPVAWTLDAAQSHIANPFTPVRDDQSIRNDITVQRVDGGSNRQVDDSSMDRYGSYEEQVSVSLEDDGQLPDQAGWRLHVGVYDGIRYPEITIDFGVAPDLIPMWLTMRIGYRIRIVNLPPQHPLEGVDLVVEGWTENLSPFGWTATLNCSPVEPWRVGVVEDPVWGRLSPVDAELATAVSADATSLTVTGEPWITTSSDPGEFPFDLLLGDVEVVTVTGITGADPQTFTVIRNVNDLGRAHPAGTTVALAHPAVIAL